MIRKVPDRNNHSRKKSKSYGKTELRLPRNRKHTLTLRFLAPVCRYEREVYSWYDFRRKRKATRRIYGYVSFVIHDGMVKLFEFSEGEGIFKCLCQGASDTESDGNLTRGLPYYRCTDPGHDQNGSDWLLYYDKTFRSWRARRSDAHPMSKHDRKIVSKFMNDSTPQERDLLHLPGYNYICPVFSRSRKCPSRLRSTILDVYGDFSKNMAFEA